MKAVSFKTAEGVDRVMVAVPEIGDAVVVEGTLRTDDPFVIAALDAHPMVERGKAPKTEAPVEPVAETDPEGDN